VQLKSKIVKPNKVAETCSSPEKQSNNRESIGIKQQTGLGKKIKQTK